LQPFFQNKCESDVVVAEWRASYFTKPMTRIPAVLAALASFLSNVAIDPAQ